jgi:transcriptional regulator with XRE-family HTH domain
MHRTFRSMTLQTLLQQHGITTIKELMHRTGLSRQHCWGLWHAYDGVGKATAKRLHERLGIPAEALLQVDPVPARPRRQASQARPRLKGRPLAPPKEEA